MNFDFTNKIPKKIKMVILHLEANGFESYIVGGSVRDIILGKVPCDFDVTTSASPEQIQSLFEDSFYENSFGTVGVVLKDFDNEVVEVTPFRDEGKYTDGRHPDSVSFGVSLNEDLKRRDFTINAMAYRLYNDSFVDLYGGVEDLSAKIIRAVGSAEDRFNEDALRMLRAVRFSAQLGFSIEHETKKAILSLSKNIKNISMERIRDEFVKIIESDNPMHGLILSHETKLLEYFLPELEKGIGVRQNQAHSFDVWEHNLRTLQHAADKKWPLHVRLSAIFHDISKPETRRFSKEKGDYTFYGHEVVGGRVTREIMKRLKFSKELTDKVSMFVRWHMFFSDTEQISMSAVRRLINNVGKENVWDLMDLRVCDRIGTGRPKENPYRLRKYKAMVEEAMQDPISVSMLKIDGLRIMEVTHETPGPKIGYILHSLLEEVIEDPNKNSVEYLENRAMFLVKLSPEELKSLGKQGKEKKDVVQNEEIKKIKRKFKV